MRTVQTSSAALGIAVPSPALFRGSSWLCQAPQFGACWGLCSLLPLIPEAPGTATAQTRMSLVQPLSLQSSQRNLEAERGKRRQHSP